MVGASRPFYTQNDTRITSGSPGVYTRCKSIARRGQTRSTLGRYYLTGERKRRTTFSTNIRRHLTS